MDGGLLTPLERWVSLAVTNEPAKILCLNSCSYSTFYRVRKTTFIINWAGS